MGAGESCLLSAIFRPDIRYRTGAYGTDRRLDHTVIDSLVSPIGRRIGNAPEGRGGARKFHCNVSRPRQLLPPVNHAALFLFSAVCVLHEEPLLRRYLFRQGHQRTVRIDNQV